jgi:Tfp pilus assembly PilM family ATPase
VVDAETSWRFRKDGERKSLRVHHYADLPHTNAQNLTADLRALAEANTFTKKAWVNLWEVASSHQYVLLPTASHDELEDAARHRGAALLGIAPRDVAVGTFIGQKRAEPGRPSKTEVSFFAASLDEIHSRLRPIVEAGFVVEGITTPCGALWSQARLRPPSMRGAVQAFVALSANMSSLAIFSNGFLLYARDFSWGYSDMPLGPAVAPDREALAIRLAAELRRSFLYLKQYWEEDVSMLLLCGDMPEIRSLTAPLIERLNIEVETLDTLEGIDAAMLPEPADRFLEQVAAFRLASAIAVESTPVNLLPLEVTVARANRTGRRVYLAGAAAAVALAAFLYARADVDQQSAERQVIAAEPQVRPISVSQEVPPNLQGARMAQILEAASQAAPRGVAVTALNAMSDGPAWRVSIDARSESDNLATARVAADGFIAGLAKSPIFGSPTRPVTRRTVGNSLELTAEYVVTK